jgi:hypothetical protein
MVRVRVRFWVRVRVRKVFLCCRVLPSVASLCVWCCLVFDRRILPWVVLCCLVFDCLILPWVVLCCLVFDCLTLPWVVLCCLVFDCLTLPWVVLCRGVLLSCIYLLCREDF